MSELAVMRKQTKSYIAYNPSSIALVRGARVPDGAGGTITQDPAPIAAQTVRIIQQREGEGTERRNRDGEVVRPSLVMMMEWNGDAVEGDQFTWDGNKTAEVVYVQDLKTQGEVYERLCEVVLR